jgi:polyferredoxin
MSEQPVPVSGGPTVGSASRRAVWPAFYVLFYFLACATATLLAGGEVAPAGFLVAVGVFVTTGCLIQARARTSRKALGRRLSVALVGLSLFLGPGIFGRQSFQLEGFLFYAFAGIAGGVVVHYLVAKLVGPLFIGRAWCAWGCWIWMVFDYLPWKRSPGRRPGLAWIRQAHFALSLGLVATLVFVVRYDHGFTWQTTDGLLWFVAGCAAYYAVGIALAAALKDNRAFCKYVCPVTVFLRMGSRLSLLRVAGTRELCTECGACEQICPMDVKVTQFVTSGRRVSDPECTLCQRCVAACAGGHLRLSLGR